MPRLGNQDGRVSQNSRYSLLNPRKGDFFAYKLLFSRVSPV
jgi:hypothetical protein